MARGRGGNGGPLVGAVLAIHVAPTGYFVLAGFEATAVVEVARRGGVALVLYGGTTDALRDGMGVAVYGIRVGEHASDDARGQAGAWSVYYAHGIAVVG